MDLSLGKFGEYIISNCSQNFAALFELNYKRKRKKPSCTIHEGFLIFYPKEIITQNQKSHQQLLYRSVRKL